MFHTLKFEFDGFRHATKQAQNSPVLDRNQLGGVTVNTYTTVRRKEVVQHAASEFILHKSSMKELKESKQNSDKGVYLLEAFFIFNFSYTTYIFSSTE